MFEDQHFTTKVETQHGRVKILQNFRERSKLLRGIENYRVAILEADPQTFIVPNHWDAEAIIFVAKGTIFLFAFTLNPLMQNRLPFSVSSFGYSTSIYCLQEEDR